jgi:hypothetical protein
VLLKGTNLPLSLVDDSKLINCEKVDVRDDLSTAQIKQLIKMACYDPLLSGRNKLLESKTCV